MLLDIKPEDKRKLGIIIKHYRKNVYSQTYKLDWKVNNFIKDRYGNTICSVQTLNMIESGKGIKDDIVYDILLRKLNLKYNYEKDIGNITRKYGKKLVTYIELYDTEEVLKICEEYRNELAPYQKYIIERYYIYAIQKIKKFHESTEQFHKNEIQILKRFFPIYDKYIKMALLDVIFNYYFNHEELKKVEAICNRLELHKNPYIKNQCNLAYLKIRQKRYYEAVILTDHIEKCYTETNNYRGIIEALHIKINIITYIQPQDQKLYENEQEKKIKKYKKYLSKRMLAVIYYNMGLCYIERGDFEKAYDYFLRVLEMKKIICVKAAFHLNYVCTVLNWEVPKIELTSKDRQEESEEFLKLYHFYEMKQENKSPEELEMYVMKELMPIIKNNNDDKAYKIFEQEIMLCSKKTGNKQIFYNYKRIGKRLKYD